MHRYSQWQTISFACVCPFTDNIAVRTYIHRVPFLIGGIPQVKVVVMLTQRKEVACPYALIESHQLLRIPVFGLPVTAQLFQAIVLTMVFTLPLTLEIHVPGIPVACLGLTLRSPVGPDAELGILEPLRTLPLSQALPCWFKLSLFYGYVGGRFLCIRYRMSPSAEGCNEDKKMLFFHIRNMIIGTKVQKRHLCTKFSS